MDIYLQRLELQVASGSITVRNNGSSCTYCLLSSGLTANMRVLRRRTWVASTQTETIDFFPWFDTPDANISMFSYWYRDEYGYDTALADIEAFLTANNIISTDVDTFCTWFYQGTI